jgi:hypothetical protein
MQVTRLQTRLPAVLRGRRQGAGQWRPAERQAAPAGRRGARGPAHCQSHGRSVGCSVGATVFVLSSFWPDTSAAQLLEQDPRSSRDRCFGELVGSCASRLGVFERERKPAIGKRLGVCCGPWCLLLPVLQSRPSPLVQYCCTRPRRRKRGTHTGAEGADVRCPCRVQRLYRTFRRLQW